MSRERLARHQTRPPWSKGCFVTMSILIIKKVCMVTQVASSNIEIEAKSLKVPLKYLLRRKYDNYRD